MKKYFLAIMATLASFEASADALGKVDQLLVGRQGNQVFVQVDGSVDSINCRTRNDWHYFLELDTLGGKEIYSALLGAKISGQEIKILSSGNCDDTGQGLELINYIVLQ